MATKSSNVIARVEPKLKEQVEAILAGIGISESTTINMYDSMAAQLKLMCELNAGRKSGEEEGWIYADDVRSHFRARANAE